MYTFGSCQSIFGQSVAPYFTGEMRFILNMILELAMKINYTPLYDMGKGSHLSKLAEMSRINMGIQKGYSIIYNNSLSY